jgi:hypothetical protein
LATLWHGQKKSVAAGLPLGFSEELPEGQQAPVAGRVVSRFVWMQRVPLALLKQLFRYIDCRY